MIKTHYIAQRASSSSLPSALLSLVVAQPTHKAVSCDVPFIARVAKHPHTLVDQPSHTAVSCEVSLILRVAKHSHTHTHTQPPSSSPGDGIGHSVLGGSVPLWTNLSRAGFCEGQVEAG